MWNFTGPQIIERGIEKSIDVVMKLGHCSRDAALEKLGTENIMKDICSKYESIGDILEYGNITEKEAVILCNQIINESISENDNEILEAMYHAIFIGIVNRKIIDKLDVNTIVKMLDKFNEEVSDYIVTILAYTGKKEYAETIKQIGQRFENIDIDDALIELNAMDRQ
ncbi:MAG: hypothetical protein K2H41_03250 [Acetatifactor sp.]|nr:hypothetical protein [Acetatifactor sp.]